MQCIYISRDVPNEISEYGTYGTVKNHGITEYGIRHIRDIHIWITIDYLYTPHKCPNEHSKFKKIFHLPFLMIGDRFSVIRIFFFFLNCYCHANARKA
jgi:hypothetical protein